MAVKYLKTSSGNFLKISSSSGETWKLNTSVYLGDASYIEIGGSYHYGFIVNFVSNNQEFSAFTGVNKWGKDMGYWTDTTTESYTVVSDGSSAMSTPTFNEDNAYRTITFETAPTGDLLTWLQTNAVKQESEAANFLYTE